MNRLVLAVILAGLAFPTPEAGSGQEVIRETPYSGPRLEGEVFLCRSDDVTAGGFRKELQSGKVVQITEVARQQRVTTWRISIRQDDATVTAFTGATQTLEAQESFAVRRTEKAMALFRRDGLNFQTITIDLENSSFVYSGHSVGALMNKVNIFVGRCQPYA